MSLEDVIGKSPAPRTVDSLSADLGRLGVEKETTLVVHSSLSAMGYVIGGPVAVILALERAVGERATLAMPSHSVQLTDPSRWRSPPLPAHRKGKPNDQIEAPRPERWRLPPAPPEWHDAIRAQAVPFYPDMTPTFGMGAVVECFRTRQGVLRSRHPFVSWVAKGPDAVRITDGHALDMSQGEGSPLARLYDIDAKVLLVGVEYFASTIFHLAEYRCRHAERERCQRETPIAERDRVRWVACDDIYLSEADFKELGEAFERETGAVTTGLVGGATAKLFSARAAVDFAVAWMNANRA